MKMTVVRLWNAGRLKTEHSVSAIIGETNGSRAALVGWTGAGSWRVSALRIKSSVTRWSHWLESVQVPCALAMERVRELCHWLKEDTHTQRHTGRHAKLRGSMSQYVLGGRKPLKCPSASFHIFRNLWWWCYIVSHRLKKNKKNLSSEQV